VVSYVASFFCRELHNCVIVITDSHVWSFCNYFIYFKNSIPWDVMPCVLVEVYHFFGGKCINRLPQQCRWQVPLLPSPQSWQICIRLHNITSQNTLFLCVTFMFYFSCVHVHNSFFNVFFCRWYIWFTHTVQCSWFSSIPSGNFQTPESWNPFRSHPKYSYTCQACWEGILGGWFSLLFVTQSFSHVNQYLVRS